MKKIFFFAIMASVAFWSVGCTHTDDIEVHVATDKKYNLKAYKTYQIARDSGVYEQKKNGEVVDESDRVNMTVESIINDVLIKAGKRPVSKHPDMYVVYIGGTRKEQAKCTLCGEPEKTVKSAPEAALLIMLVDAKSNIVMRVAVAEAELKNLPDEAQKKRIAYAVEKMLKDI